MGELPPFPLLQESFAEQEEGSTGVGDVCGLRDVERTRK